MLSVCLSVTNLYRIKTTKHIVEIVSLSESPMIIVIGNKSPLRNSNRIILNKGISTEMKYKISAFVEQLFATFD